MEKGIKFDKDKPRWDLLPWREVEEVVKVLTSGARKYNDNNWKYVDDAKKRYFAAMIRHVLDYWKGESVNTETFKDRKTDEDIITKHKHLSHACCCLLFLMWLENEEL